eukprot:4870609-Heterocapsa_arctica.AAC.1
MLATSTLTVVDVAFRALSTKLLAASHLQGTGSVTDLATTSDDIACDIATVCDLARHMDIKQTGSDQSPSTPPTARPDDTAAPLPPLQKRRRFDAPSAD